MNNQTLNSASAVDSAVTSGAEVKAANDCARVELLPYIINRLTTVINKRWLEEIRSYNLTIPRWQVLSVLYRCDGSRVGLVAEICGVEQAIISRVIDQMVRQKLVEKRAARSDSRAVEVWLTGKGRDIYEVLQPAADAHVERLVEALIAAGGGSG